MTVVRKLLAVERTQDERLSDHDEFLRQSRRLPTSLRQNLFLYVIHAVAGVREERCIKHIFYDCVPDELKSVSDVVEPRAGFTRCNTHNFWSPLSGPFISPLKPSPLAGRATRRAASSDGDC